MNPDIAELESHKELPKPNPKEGELAALSNIEQPRQQAETSSKAAELPGGPGSMTPPTQPSQASLQQPPPIASPAKPVTIHVSDSPDVAEDADLIEKEWVLKAKAIVEQTHDDPHSQKKEISKFKADYMKKRYNKDLKVTEE